MAFTIPRPVFCLSGLVRYHGKFGGCQCGPCGYHRVLWVLFKVCTHPQADPMIPDNFVGVTTLSVGISGLSPQTRRETGDTRAIIEWSWESVGGGPGMLVSNGFWTAVWCREFRKANIGTT